MSRSSFLRTSKNTVMLLLGTIMRMVATFGFVIYSASVLGLEGFGKYSLVVDLFELFLGLAGTAVAILLTRDIARWPHLTDRLLTSASVLAISLAASTPLLMLLLGFTFGYSRDTVQALSISSIAIFPGVICLALEAVFVAHERAEFVTIGTAVESLLRVALGVVALKLGYGLMELMWIMVGSRTVLLIVYAAAVRRMTAYRWHFRWATTVRFARQWRVFAAENWMAAIYTNLSVLVLSAITSEAAVGLYSAAGKFVRLGAVFSRSFTTAVFPVMSRMFAESPESFSRLYRHTVGVLYALAFPIVIGVSVLTDRIVAMLYTEEFQETATVLRVLIWVLLVDFLNPFLSHVLFAQGQQHRSMYVAAISLVTNGIACIVLVHAFGATGAALATVISGLVAMGSYTLFAMPGREVLATCVLALRIFVAALGMGAVVFLMRNEMLVLIVGMAAVVYASLLLILQAVRVEDLRFFRTTFLSRSPA